MQSSSTTSKFMTSYRGESLAQILDTATEGASLDSMLNEGDKRMGKRGILEAYINLLIRYGLASRDGDTISTQDFYRQLDREVLPYALDIITRQDINNNQNRTTLEIEMEILRDLSQPRNQTYFTNAFGLQKRVGKYLKDLTEDGYIKATKGKSGRLFYERTEEGSKLLRRVNDCLEQLKANYK